MRKKRLDKTYRKGQKLFFSLFLTFFLLGCTCLPNPEIPNVETIKILYKTYENGEISECLFEGNRVYPAGLNAYDARSYIYDSSGKLIGSCNYAWNQVDSICSQLDSCEVVYRVKKNIWEQPGIDKYNLKKRLR